MYVNGEKKVINVYVRPQGNKRRYFYLVKQPIGLTSWKPYLVTNLLVP